jgi:hypothetical protein
MKFRTWGSSIAVAAVVAISAAMGSANAAVVYTLQTGLYDPDGDDGPIGMTASATFTLTLPTFITSPLESVTLDSCSISGAAGYSCSTSTFYTKANPFGGTDDYIGFNSSTEDGGGTGFLFFVSGALGAPGVYSNLGFPVNTPGFGNFAEATLTVSGGSEVPLPAALPLFATVLAGGGLVAWRRKRKAVAATD